MDGPHESLLLSDHGGSRYGLIPQCELKEACNEADWHALSLEQHIYAIKVAFDSEKFPTAKGEEFVGTAIYVGKGYFITCAHNVAWPGSSENQESIKAGHTRRRLFIVVKLPALYGKDAAKNEERIEVDLVKSAFVGEPKNNGRFFVKDIATPSPQDLAVVKVRPDDLHHFENISVLKPALPNKSKRIALSAINGPLEYHVEVLNRFEEGLAPKEDDFNKAVECLRPGFVTEWITDSLDLMPSNKDGSEATFVGFRISTTPGSSGSLLSQDGRFVGVHVCGPPAPINKSSRNRGVLISTKLARDFLRDALEELIVEDADWRDFVASEDDDGPEPVEESEPVEVPEAVEGLVYQFKSALTGIWKGK